MGASIDALFQGAAVRKFFTFLGVCLSISLCLPAVGREFPANIDLPQSTTRLQSLSQLQGIIRVSNKVQELPADVTPTPWNANQRSIIYANGCMENREVTKRARCEFGDTSSSRVMWLIGDSHAAQWFYAAQIYAIRHHYKLVVHAKSNCELTHPILKKLTWPACTGLNAYWRSHIKASRPSLVLVGLYQGWTKSAVSEVQSSLKLLAKSAGHVVLLGDTAKRDHETRHCLRTNPHNVDLCNTTVNYAFDFVTASRFIRGAKKNNYQYLDVHDWLCQQRICPAIAENLILYRDVTHITGVAAAWLAPIFDKQLSKILSAD